MEELPGSPVLLRNLSELEFWSPKQVSPSPTESDQDVVTCPGVSAHVHVCVWYSRPAV